VTEIHSATIVESEPAGPGFHTVVGELAAPVAVVAGQWGAFHTGVPNPVKVGEVPRRAWSFAEIDGCRFRLLVALVGPGTTWLSERRPGDELRFSGPWGTRFRLDEGVAPASFFASGSGIAPIGAMVDACIAAGRPARLLWETSARSLHDRIAGWRRAGVAVDIAPRLEPDGDGTWWFAGDGPRLDEVVGDAPPERVERFYTPAPKAGAAS
jgi:ferredoxin-NADP reductase